MTNNEQLNENVTEGSGIIFPPGRHNPEARTSMTLRDDASLLAERIEALGGIFPPDCGDEARASIELTYSERQIISRLLREFCDAPLSNREIIEMAERSPLGSNDKDRDRGLEPDEAMLYAMALVLLSGQLWDSIHNGESGGGPELDRRSREIADELGGKIIEADDGTFVIRPCPF
jgi:hypothetical protein